MPPPSSQPRSRRDRPMPRYTVRRVMAVRHDAARNMARYYCLTIERNLFGEFSLVRTWGRIGRPSQEQIELHATEQDAQAAMAHLVRQKQRKGYA